MHVQSKQRAQSPRETCIVQNLHALPAFQEGINPFTGQRSWNSILKRKIKPMQSLDHQKKITSVHHRSGSKYQQGSSRGAVTKQPFLLTHKAVLQIQFTHNHPICSAFIWFLASKSTHERVIFCLLQQRSLFIMSKAHTQANAVAKCSNRSRETDHVGRLVVQP